MEKNNRVVKVFKDGVWVEAKPKDLKKGAIFKMFEPDGTQVHKSDALKALNDCSKIESVWGLQTKSVDLFCEDCGGDNDDCQCGRFEQGC
jgi:hypothetical protein